MALGATSMSRAVLLLWLLIAACQLFTTVEGAAAPPRPKDDDDEEDLIAALAALGGLLALGLCLGGGYGAYRGWGGGGGGCGWRGITKKALVKAAVEPQGAELPPVPLREYPDQANATSSNPLPLIEYGSPAPKSGGCTATSFTSILV